MAVRLPGDAGIADPNHQHPALCPGYVEESHEVVEVPDPSKHHVFKVPRETLLPFFQAVPRLFAEEQAGVDAAYQSCLYRTEHDFGVDDLERIENAFDLQPAQWGSVSPGAVIKRLDGMKYPETQPIGMIEAVSGMNLKTLSHYLHFFHHTYPIFDKPTLKGLAKLGIDLPYVLVRDVEVYGLYIAALDELKDRIPFWCVPEANIHLTRILQAALAGWGK